VAGPRLSSAYALGTQLFPGGLNQTTGLANEHEDFVTAAVKAGQAGGELTRGGRLPPRVVVDNEPRACATLVA
jgi:hypothetical protein